MAEAAKVLQFEEDTHTKPNLYLVPEIPEVNEYQKAYDDAATFFAETLEGQIRTKFEFNFDGRELYGRDGRALGPVFETALEDAEKTAEQNPNLLFEQRRRQIELGEYQDMIKMNRGELPNTMVVLSDMPPELMDAKEDVGGYNAKRKQTFLRVISKTPEGQTTIESQSLDMSDHGALEAIYDYFNVEPEPGELLGQRISINLPEEEQQVLVDRLTGIYDNMLTLRYGGRWHAGRTPVSHLNTYDFVKSQDDLVKSFVDYQLSDPNKAESLRYNFAAAIDQRFKNITQNHLDRQDYTPFKQHSIEQELYQAGRQAKDENKTFSGCGLTLNSNNKLEDQLNDSGYGNKTDNETKYGFDKKMYCVVCQSPPKKHDKKQMCGPCGICRSCDRQLKTK